MQTTSHTSENRAIGGDRLPFIAHAGLTTRVIHAARAVIHGLDAMSPLVDLAVRLYVASVFFQSGLTKLASWSTTLSLFENEYAVPFLSPEVAAYLGTTIELCFPVLLVLGLGTRLAAFALFCFNIVAALSYPDLGEAGLKDHRVWGLLLLVILLHGPGWLSLDGLIGRYFFKRHQPRG